MNNQQSKLLKALFILAVFFGITSCSGTETEDTKEIAEDRNEAKFNDNDSEADAMFLVNAAEISRAEISLGQLAMDVSKTSHVKDLGKMMTQAHTKSLDELTALAKSKSITLPDAQTDDSQSDYIALRDKTGREFDKAYANKMVNEHKDAIAVFEKASTDSKDQEIREWATASLPALRDHLDAAMICQTECEKVK